MTLNARGGSPAAGAAASADMIYEEERRGGPGRPRKGAVRHIGQARAAAGTENRQKD